MRIDHAMNIAHVLGCTIEELYEWKRSSTHKNGR
jgi:hypothetical protein